MPLWAGIATRLSFAPEFEDVHTYSLLLAPEGPDSALYVRLKRLFRQGRPWDSD